MGFTPTGGMGVFATYTNDRTKLEENDAEALAMLGPPSLARLTTDEEYGPFYGSEAEVPHGGYRTDQTGVPMDNFVGQQVAAPQLSQQMQRHDVAPQAPRQMEPMQYQEPPRQMQPMQYHEVEIRSEVNSELNFPSNFEGLVLGCIDADFCK